MSGSGRPEASRPSQNRAKNVAVRSAGTPRHSNSRLSSWLAPTMTASISWQSVLRTVIDSSGNEDRPGTSRHRAPSRTVS